MQRELSLAAAASTYGGATALAVGASYWVSNRVLLDGTFRRELETVHEWVRRSVPASGSNCWSSVIGLRIYP